MTDTQNKAFHFLARRVTARWANSFDDAERLVTRRYRAAQQPNEEQRRKLVNERWEIASALWHAFSATDEHERDCFLTWARALHAKASVKDPMPGAIPIDTDSELERAIYYVQKHIADTMRVCTKCGQCFFQRRKKQQICGKRCREKSNRESKRLSWQRNESVWRP